MIHLDTSFLIHALRRGSPEDVQVRGWLMASEALSISTVAWAEFLCGPVDDAARAAASVVVERQCSFTGEMASIAAMLFNGAGRRRGSMIDCMIAAAALAEGAAVATSNPDDFNRFAPFGLNLA
ncbi:MAG: type II toxin-antitoxin system VapC family toxin [bacterium]|nr:type II toxin-antitoxin system VapC family toxin [bacterium]MDE0241820.1 type II toxin-antitoxin system VapC family toxin [bacterium]MDE0417287.1 type II toxin-antitoxin system VapC family toxin [bacterium]